MVFYCPQLTKSSAYTPKIINFTPYLFSLRVRATDGGEPAKFNETLVRLILEGGGSQNISCTTSYDGTILETRPVGMSK